MTKKTLWVERGTTIIRERTVILEQGQDRKCLAPDEGEQASVRRSPRIPRSHSQDRWPFVRQRLVHPDSSGDSNGIDVLSMKGCTSHTLVLSKRGIVTAADRRGICGHHVPERLY